MATQIENPFDKTCEPNLFAAFEQGVSAQSEIDRDVLKDAKAQIIHLIDLNGGKGHASSFKILQRIDAAIKLTEKQ